MSNLEVGNHDVTYTYTLIPGGRKFDSLRAAKEAASDLGLLTCDWKVELRCDGRKFYTLPLSSGGVGVDSILWRKTDSLTRAMAELSKLTRPRNHEDACEGSEFFETLDRLIYSASSLKQEIEWAREDAAKTPSR